MCHPVYQRGTFSLQSFGRFGSVGKYTLLTQLSTYLLWLTPGASLEFAAEPLGNVAVAARPAVLA